MKTTLRIGLACLVALPAWAVWLPGEGETTAPHPSAGATTAPADTAVPIPTTAASAPNAAAPPSTAATEFHYSAGVGEIVKLHEGGVGTDVVRAYIAGSQIPYSLNAAEIVRLHRLGVPGETIAALIRRGGELRARTAEQPARTEPVPAPAAASVPCEPPPAMAVSPPANTYVYQTMPVFYETPYYASYPYYGFAYGSYWYPNAWWGGYAPIYVGYGGGRYSGHSGHAYPGYHDGRPPYSGRPGLAPSHPGGGGPAHGVRAGVGRGQPHYGGVRAGTGAGRPSGFGGPGHVVVAGGRGGGGGGHGRGR
jgi:hypothetical protein